MAGRLEGKVALITGAASGIGAATALRFAQEGAVVAGYDLNDKFEPDWEEAVRVAPGSSFAAGDVRDEDRIRAVVAEARQAFGGIDIVVNSAGVAGGGMVHMLEQEAWDHVMDINMKGTYLVNKHVVPAMMERGGGSVINVASVEGIEGFMGGSVYNASKGAVILLTKNMAIDYAASGIRVNAICPGFIDTPLLRATFAIEGAKVLEDQIRAAHQLGRFGQPVELANAALFLASDEASFVTGVALPVDGGYLAGHRFTG